MALKTKDLLKAPLARVTRWCLPDFRSCNWSQSECVCVEEKRRLRDSNIFTRALMWAGLAGLAVGVLCAGAAALWLGHSSKQRPDTLSSLVSTITCTAHMCVWFRRSRADMWKNRGGEKRKKKKRKQTQACSSNIQQDWGWGVGGGGWEDCDTGGFETFCRADLILRNLNQTEEQQFSNNTHRTVCWLEWWTRGHDMICPLTVSPGVKGQDNCWPLDDWNTEILYVRVLLNRTWGIMVKMCQSKM